MLAPDVVLHARSDFDTPVDGSAVERLDGLTGVVVRVKSITVHDNRKGGFWPFSRDGAADVYPIVLVANGMGADPIRFSTPYMFNGIRDGDALPIAAPGITVERTLHALPPFLDVHVLVMRSQKAQRDFAKAITAALQSDEGQSLLESATAMVTDPMGSAAVGIGTALLDLYLDFLGAEKDKQIFYGIGSFEKSPDALGVNRTHLFEDKRYASVAVEIVGVK